jgi:cytochrome c oxidase subunit I+III
LFSSLVFGTFYLWIAAPDWPAAATPAPSLAFALAVIVALAVAAVAAHRGCTAFLVAVHAGIGLLFLVSNLLRLGAGRVSLLRSLDLRLTRLWLDYAALTAVIALGLVLALPLLVVIALGLVLALPLLVAMLGARP